MIPLLLAQHCQHLFTFLQRKSFFDMTYDNHVPFFDMIHDNHISCIKNHNHDNYLYDKTFASTAMSTLKTETPPTSVAAVAQVPASKVHVGLWTFGT